MGFLKAFNRFASDHFGLMMKRSSGLYAWQRQSTDDLAPIASSLPSGAATYLRTDNPRLVELQRRYAQFDGAVTSSAVWSNETIDEHSLRFFRGDNPYVWQRPGLNSNELAYVLSYLSLKASDAGEILDALTEDGLFGARTIAFDGRLVSRDLLDSVREIQFLQDHAGIGASSQVVLDIGAGYGRLAHRLHEAMPSNLVIYATDAIPHSTFLAEYYLRYRAAARAKVVPLDEIDAFFDANRVDVATNIHSFSECTPEAIAWWAERLAHRQVRYLMVTPNGQARHGPIRCETNSGLDMEPIFERVGYRIKVREPRHPEPLVQRYGLDPAQFNLFELR